jgi:subtilisin family serine protease
MDPLDLVKLTPLMERTRGNPQITIGLIDGPVALNHPDLSNANIRMVKGYAACGQPPSPACLHGTFVAGILCAKRGGIAPAICPSCTLLVHPIFAEANGKVPSATPEELASAIVQTIDAGARVLNMSVALNYPSSKGERLLEEALDYASRRGVIVVVAAGNQGTLGSSAITRHPWVIPVVACDLGGSPLRQSNLGSSIGRRGLSVPGEAITSLGAAGDPLTIGGTSAVTPYVCGTIALLWSEFPDASATKVKVATMPLSRRRTTVVPPLLNAWSAYQLLANSNLNEHIA